MNSSKPSMHVESFFDPQSSTLSHVVVDLESRQCAVIDSVLGFDMYSATTDTECADKIITYIKTNELENKWLLETHIHADHLTSAHYLQSHIGGKTAIGSGIVEVLEHWVPVFETTKDTLLNGLQFDRMFQHQDQFQIGNLTITVLHTPGHTPACVSYVVNDSKNPVAFVGDTLFAPQRGTSRVDFPGGDAKQLFDSIKQIYQLPDKTAIYLCHDYPDTVEQLVIKTTVGEQKHHNKMLKADTLLADFIETRTQRDKKLAVPKLIYPAIQTNMRLGHLGKASDSGIQYLKIPVNQYPTQRNLPFNQLDEGVAVSSQLTSADVTEIATKGFKTIICNRFDGEEPNQTNFDDIAAVAESLDIQCIYLPFNSNQLTVELVEQFAQLLSEMPKPILAYCRSGTRSAKIWAHSQLDKISEQAVLTMCKNAGYQIDLMEPQKHENKGVNP